ncbi:hypothetical protein V5N11_018648 [Cardamine amara subsp. amara]|uniref:Uncharacterized protein n=1 Tax=Cardamine amara subsp. amara TaxID=228776 RepID=A0ABD1BHS9_CARAN
MFAARVRASLKPLLHGRRHCFSPIRNYEIEAISKRVSHDRVGIKLLYGAFHSSPQCYTSGSDVGLKTQAPELFSNLEDDPFTELGSVEKDGDRNVVLKLLTEKLEPELSQKTKGKKKKKNKQQQVSESISKPKLLTEKPELSWKTNGKKKTEVHTSLPARNATNLDVSFSKPSKSSSPIQDHKSKAQNIITPSSEAKNEASSNVSSTSNTPSNHPSSVVVIRIGNLNSETADSMIHSMCLSIAVLEGFTRLNEDTVDVVFRVKNLNEADSILEELKDTTLNCSQWTAEIVPEAEEASKDQVGLKISSCYDYLDKQLNIRRVLGRDLETLLHSIMHLENHPMARERN